MKKSLAGGIIAFILATACCWLPALIVLFGGASLVGGLTQGLNLISFPFMVVGVGLMGYGLYKFKISGQNKEAQSVKIITQSTLTCPHCNKTTEMEMPTDACQYFFDCPECKSVIKPLKGDCCVYCSYGTEPCPPIQEGKACC